MLPSTPQEMYEGYTKDMHGLNLALARRDVSWNEYKDGCVLLESVWGVRPKQIDTIDELLLLTEPNTCIHPVEPFSSAGKSALAYGLDVHYRILQVEMGQSSLLAPSVVIIGDEQKLDRVLPKILGEMINPLRRHEELHRAWLLRQ